MKPSISSLLLLDRDGGLLLSLVLDLDTVVVERDLEVFRLVVIESGLLVEQLGGLALGLALALARGLALARAPATGCLAYAALVRRCIGRGVTGGHVKLSLNLAEAGLEQDGKR